MKILIVLPNWLGDALMATSAMENLANQYPQAEWTLIGSHVTIHAIKDHPNCRRYFIDETKKKGNRLLATIGFAKVLGRHDAAISFRKNFFTSLLLYFTQSKIRTGEYSWHSFLVMNQTVRFTGKRHLVENYNLLIQKLIGEKRQPGKLKLYIPVEKFARKTMGINPGATYGSAKRWNPDKFAKAAAAFARDYDIVIFGGEKERDIAAEVEKNLKKLNVFNYTNLAGKTTVEELCAKIGALSLFITNDSGPMHVAAAYQIPTVAIFGPTKYKETSPWENPGAVIVRREDLPCSPCMKHHCPLKHHHCMEWITAEEVVKQLKNLAG